MKIITEQYYDSLVDSIIKEKEKQAESIKQVFIGINPEDLRHELDRQLGTPSWVIVRNPAKFDKPDINAVANARFMRKTGISLILGVFVLILGLSIVTRYIQMIPLYYNIYYTVIGAIALVFIYIYSKMQGKVRRELWRQLGREEKNEGK